MAVDTKAKRYSMLGFVVPSINLVIVDDGVSDADRITMLSLYNGIALAEDVGPGPYEPRHPYYWQRNLPDLLLSGGS